MSIFSAALAKHTANVQQPQWLVVPKVSERRTDPLDSNPREQHQNEKGLNSR